MFSEFKSYAFFYGLCDATFSKVWCLGSLGVIPRIYLFSLNLLFMLTIHITVHSNLNLDFYLCFHSKTLLILVHLENPIIPIIFYPIPHQNLTLILQNPSYTRSAPDVLNQILLFPLVLCQNMVGSRPKTQFSWRNN